MLLPLAVQLASGFDVWLPDLAGHGSEPGDEPTLNQVLKRLALQLSSVGPLELLVGHSMGAWLVRELLRRDAIRAPRGVVWISPAVVESAVRRPKPRKRPERRKTDPVAEILRQIELETGRPASPGFAEHLAAGALWPPSRFPTLLAKLSHELSKPVPRLRPGVPVLVLCGEDDSVVPPQQAMRVAEATAGAELIRLPGLGHYPAATGDDGVARAIREFASRLGESARTPSPP